MRHWLRIATAMLALPGCDWSLERMTVQARCEPDEATLLLAGGTCNQPLPDGVIPFASAGLDARKLDRAALERGRAHFEVVCAVCHGLLGDGRSPVAKHMLFRAPPSLHEPELLQKPDAFFFLVISDGYGLMPSYAHMLSPTERSVVIAYVRALQRSQNVGLDELPEAIRQEAASWLH